MMSAVCALATARKSTREPPRVILLMSAPALTSDSTRATSPEETASKSSLYVSESSSPLACLGSCVEAAAGPMGDAQTWDGDPGQKSPGAPNCAAAPLATPQSTFIGWPRAAGVTPCCGQRSPQRMSPGAREAAKSGALSSLSSGQNHNPGGCTDDDATNGRWAGRPSCVVGALPAVRCCFSFSTPTAAESACSSGAS